MTWILAGTGLLLAIVMVVAWIEGGPQSVRTIEQPVTLPGAGA